MVQHSPIETLRSTMRVVVVSMHGRGCPRPHSGHFRAVGQTPAWAREKKRANVRKVSSYCQERASCRWRGSSGDNLRTSMCIPYKHEYTHHVDGFSCAWIRISSNVRDLDRDGVYAPIHIPPFGQRNCKTKQNVNRYHFSFNFFLTPSWAHLFRHSSHAHLYAPMPAPNTR